MKDEHGNEVPPIEVAMGAMASALQLLYEIADAKRVPTADELEQLFYDVLTASSQLKKLPGGVEAADRLRTKIVAEIAQRDQARAEVVS